MAYSKPQSENYNAGYFMIQRFIRILLLTSSLMLLFPGTGIGQWLNESLPIQSDKSGAYIHTECAIGLIMDDPASIQALKDFQALRKEKPEGALVLSGISDSQEGDTRNFRVRNLTNNTWRTVNFELIKRNDELLIWVEVGEFAPDKVNQEVVDRLFDAMTNGTPELSFAPDLGILEINQMVFGNPPNVDGTNTLNILITDVIDGWEPGTSSTGGFFDPVDLSPSNPNSNGADIIYLNSTPTIYRNNTVNTTRALSTAAHEYQHLIHANYGNLHIFQNEGQSEWAELLTGFQGRTPTHLSNPSQINQYLYKWRRGSTDVLFDYQRASLFHSYISERIGVHETGSITRSPSTYNNAYNLAMNNAGLSLPEILMDFHIANIVNNRDFPTGNYGYEDIRRRAVRVNFPTITYFPGQTSGERTRMLKFGGAEYIEWIGVENFQLSLTGTNGIEYALITYPLDDASEPEIRLINTGIHQLNHQYERVILVAAATEITSGTVENPSDYFFTYSSNWNTLSIIIQNLTYAGSPAFFAEIPGTPGNPQREGIRAYAKRFSPAYDSKVRDFKFTINGRDSSLIGSDHLRIVFAEGVPASGIYVPGTRIDSLDVPLSNLSRGENNINLENFDWNMQGGSEYFFILSVTDPASRVELVLDEGSTDESNPNYFPARSLAYITQPTSNTPGWTFYQNRNNLVFTVRVSGTYEGEITPPAITEQPTGGHIKLDASYKLSVTATGTPEPVFQWYKDDEPLYGANESNYTIEEMSESDQGVYTVLVANPGGYLFSEPVLLEVNFDDFVLENNYPNPFSTTTTISFITPEEITATLEIFDINGRRVDQLFRGVTLSQGRHTFTYPVSGLNRLASGVYFYHIRGNGVQNGSTYSETGKMLIIK